VQYLKNICYTSRVREVVFTTVIDEQGEEKEIEVLIDHSQLEHSSFFEN
jgi:hypothetical protein